MKTWTPIWLALCLSVGAQAHANSYVGNGGSQGDVELSVTLMQIRETFTAIEKKSANETNLCQCNRMYRGRPICEPLASLNEAQTKFCNETLFKIAPAVLKLANEDQVHFRWTNDSIEVNDQGKMRDADAVANPERREVVIHQSRFLSMNAAERVFLLTHELMHFTDVEGKPLTDKGPVGPFTGEDGSRSLVNAMAAGAGVMQGAYPREIKSYKAKRYRSQAWKPFWFTIDFGANHTFGGEYDDPWMFNNYDRAQVSFRYQWTHFGLMAAYRHEWQSGTVLTTIKTEEKINVFGVGPTYRIFFSDDPLSFWGQSHILIHALAEYYKADYKYNEDIPGFGSFGKSDSAKGFGGSFGVSYYVPIFVGFWAYVGASVEYRPYKYQDPDAMLNMNYDKTLYSGNIGVGYAF